MAIEFDRDTLERLRKLPPRKALDEARAAVYRTGDAGSDDFLDMYDQLIREGILNPAEIEEFER